MTIVPASPRTTTFTLASAGSGPFDVGFRIFDPTVKVYVNDTETFAFILSGAFAGGFSDDATITFTDPLAVDDVVRIDGAMPIARGEEYFNPDPNLTRNLNIEQGRQWAGMQQLQRDVERNTDSLADVFSARDAAELSAEDAQAWAVLAENIVGFGVLQQTVSITTVAGQDFYPFDPGFDPGLQTPDLFYNGLKQSADFYSVATVLGVRGILLAAAPAYSGDTVLYSVGHPGAYDPAQIVLSTTTGDSYIRRAAGARHELIITAGSGSSYLAGSRGSAIKMYDNQDVEHPGAFTLSTGEDDEVKARAYITREKGIVVLGSGIWDYADAINDGTAAPMGRVIVKDSFTRGSNLPAFFADKVYQSTGNTPTTPQLFQGVGLREQDQDLGSGDGARSGLFVMPFGETAWTEKGWWAWSKATSSDTGWSHDFTIGLPVDELLATAPTEVLRLRAVERDLQVNGSQVITKAELVKPGNVAGIERVIYASAVPVSHTGTVSKTAVATVVIPGGTLGPNGYLTAQFEAYTADNTTDNKVVTLEYGGTTILQTAPDNLDSTLSFGQVIWMHNANSAAAQTFRAAGAANPFGVSISTGARSGTVNSAVDQNLVLSFTLENSANTISLQRLVVTVCYMP